MTGMFTIRIVQLSGGPHPLIVWQLYDTLEYIVKLLGLSQWSAHSAGHLTLDLDNYVQDILLLLVFSNRGVNFMLQSVTIVIRY